LSADVPSTTTKPRGQATRPVPDDYGTVTPYVIVKGAEEFLTFVQRAFGAVERGRIYNDVGAIAHAEVAIGDSVVMVFDSNAKWPRTPAFLTLYVDDCDTVHQRALDAGATAVGDVSTNAWGDRGSRVTDPFGNIWWIQTHVEDVSEGRLAERMGQPEYIEQMRQSARELDLQMRAIA
jgi:uncharacterized glyoxalase superfamily protein PhnB